MMWKILGGVVVVVFVVVGINLLLTRWSVGVLETECVRSVENDVLGVSAVTAGNVGLCDGMTYSPARQICRASIKKSVEECVGLVSGYKEFCEALALGDVGRCGGEPECVALVSGVEVECEKIAARADVSFCKARVRKDVEFLKSRVDSCRDEAYALLAVRGQKERFCKKIGDSELRESCLQAV